MKETLVSDGLGRSISRSSGCAAFPRALHRASQGTEAQPSAIMRTAR